MQVLKIGSQSKVSQEWAQDGALVLPWEKYELMS